ncbi:MAG TPA: ROK family protein [Acidimicrobiia bacterium]|nr:ROK family protein [Acidimicrobiia bacterium]
MPNVDIGIELGGTKIVIGSSKGGRDLTHRIRIDTGSPDETFPRIAEILDTIGASHGIAAVGIGTFGPVDLRRSSLTFGSIMATPKPHWSDTEVVRQIIGTRDVPFAIDTDVNASLRGEVVWGAATATTGAYLTVGTGIGGGMWVDGDVVRGANHPEVGHMLVPRREDDEFEGSCPFHGACLEGLASGTALAVRYGSAPEAMSAEEKARASDLAAHYLAVGIVGLIAVIPVEVVVIGGGVAHLPGFHQRVAVSLERLSGSYPTVPYGEGGPLVVPPTLGDDAGVIGAIELARRARSGSAAKAG